jgi:hypothetical protein
MKRSVKIVVIGISLAVLFVGLVLFGLWISSLRSPALMSFDFLKGRAVVARQEADPRKSLFASIHDYHSWIQYYSFEADFSDVCKAADAELLPLGFYARTHSTDGNKHRTYTLNKVNSGKSVMIFQRERFVGSPNAQSPESPNPKAFRRERSDGWVTIKIERGRIPLWPPRYLWYRLKWRLQAAGWQKSTKNPPSKSPVKILPEP